MDQVTNIKICIIFILLNLYETVSIDYMKNNMQRRLNSKDNSAIYNEVPIIHRNNDMFYWTFNTNTKTNEYLEITLLEAIFCILCSVLIGLSIGSMIVIILHCCIKAYNMNVLKR
eukprot:491110_1